MHEIAALAWKDLRLLLRDRGVLFFTFVFPILMAVFFGSIFSGGGGQGMKVAVVDEDGTDESKAFIAKLQSAPELRVTLLPRAEAREQVRRGGQVAMIVLVEGFGRSRRNPFAAGPPRVELGVDPVRRAEEGMLQGVLTKFAAQDLQKTFTDPALARRSVEDSRRQLRAARGIPETERARLDRFLGELDGFMAGGGSAAGPGFQGFEPLRIESSAVVVERRGPRNAFAISFPQGIIWGVIGCVATFGISIVSERTRGTLVRLQMAPIGRAQILAGKALACFVTTVGVAVSLLLIGRLFFNVRPNSLPLLAAGIAAVALGFVGIMMALAVMGRTEQSVSGMCWAVLLVLSMLGGGMVPLALMPAWMQPLSSVSPIKWAILAVEGAIWRGFTPGEMLLPCAIVLGVGAVCFAVGARVLRWTD